MHINDFKKQTRVVCRAVEGAALVGDRELVGELTGNLAGVCDLEAGVIELFATRLVAMGPNLISIRQAISEFMVAVRCAPPEMAEKLCAYSEEDDPFGEGFLFEMEPEVENAAETEEVIEDEAPLVKKMMKLRG
jgi:hypothetical protein